MQFLSARWLDLVMVNYVVDPVHLEPLVPPGTRIDRFQDQVFVSLVAFMFVDTRVLGIPIPFHTRFEEVNLRFYVVPIDQPERRSVTFIRELVPRAAIPLIANTLFYENYRAVPMAHRCQPGQYAYSWRPSKGPASESSVSVSVDVAAARIPPAGSLEEFITEHYWGYAKAPRHALEYRVTHPQWACTRVDDYQLDVDFAATYGQEFGWLQTVAPHSVLYAVGSEVTVSFPKAFGRGVR